MQLSDSLLAAIRSHPDDDAPRLEYAARLDAEGDARGEFIRVQCELAKLRGDEIRYDELRTREQQLLSEWEATWIAEIGADSIVYVEFRRGFVETIRLRIVDSATPFIQASNSRIVSVIRQLSLRECPIQFDVAQQILQSQYISRVRKLDLDNCGVSVSALELLATSQCASELEDLILSSNPIQDFGVLALTSSPKKWKLSGLNLMNAEVSDAGFSSLLRWSGAWHLQELDLRRNRIGPRGLEGLSKNDSILSKLRVLILEDNVIGDVGISCLVSATRFSVQVLGLNFNEIGDAGIVSIAASARAASLRSLDLRGNNFGDRATIMLADSPNLNNLRELYISCNPNVKSAGQIAVAYAKGLGGLEELAIDCLTDAAVAAFAHTPALPKLKVLDTRESDLTSEAQASLEARFDEVI